MNEILMRIKELESAFIKFMDKARESDDIKMSDILEAEDVLYELILDKEEDEK